MTMPSACSIDVRIAASDGVLPGGIDGSGPGVWVQQVRIWSLAGQPDERSNAPGDHTHSGGMIRARACCTFRLTPLPAPSLPCPLQGDVVAISPYESHLDSRLYGDAAGTYNPGRCGLSAASLALAILVPLFCWPMPAGLVVEACAVLMSSTWQQQRRLACLPPRGHAMHHCA